MFYFFPQISAWQNYLAPQIEEPQKKRGAPLSIEARVCFAITARRS